LSPARPHLGFWVGLAAFVVATVAVFVPGQSSVLLSFVACAVAVIAGLAGDRFYAGATALVAGANWFLLNSPFALFGTSTFGWLMAALAAFSLLAPFGAMLLRYTGQVEFGVPAGTASLPALVRNPQDFFGGVALLELAIFAWRASADLPGQQGFAFGPGTAPRLFIFLLALNALGIMAHGLAVAGPALEKYAIRGPLFVTAATFAFAASIRTLGLVISSFLLIVIASLATPEMRWKETLIWGALLAAFCAFLFPYVLNLPMQLWPRFW